MNKTNKKKWVKALRSGEYTQAENQLCLVDSDRSESFCCRSEERRVGKECRSRWSPYH